MIVVSAVVSVVVSTVIPDSTPIYSAPSAAIILSMEDISNKVSESGRQSEHISHIGQVKRETMDRRACMRMQIVMERRESTKGETMDRRNSMKVEMVIDKKDSMQMEIVTDRRMKG